MSGACVQRSAPALDVFFFFAQVGHGGYSWALYCSGDILHLERIILLMRWKGFKLLEAQTSVTGYVSVFENATAGYRLMRCDQSLLGGQFITSHGVASSDSVFTVFNALEAVRLMYFDNAKSRYWYF